MSEQERTAALCSCVGRLRRGARWTPHAWRPRTGQRTRSKSEHWFPLWCVEGGIPRGLGCPLICPDWGSTGAHTLKLMTPHSADVCTEGPCAVVRSENAQTEQTCSRPVLPEGPSAAAISSGSGVGRRSSQLPTWGRAREGPATVTSVLLESL